MKAKKQNQSVTATSMESDLSKLMEQYGSGPVQFTKADDALYERHLIFDNVMERKGIGARERFEAIARSVRDVLSQRWVRTEKTYERENAKRVYYLSMEFLTGRSLGTTSPTSCSIPS
jgi:starch phosphorylase